MNQIKLKKGCAVTIILYGVLSLVFYWICGDQLHYRDQHTDMLTAMGIVEEITSDTIVTQSIPFQGGWLTGLTLYGANYARKNTGVLHLELYNGEEMLAAQDVDVATVEDNKTFFVPFDTQVPGGIIQLRITAPNGAYGNAVTLYYGSTRSAAKTEIDAALREDELVRVNGVALMADCAYKYTAGNTCGLEHIIGILWRRALCCCVDSAYSCCEKPIGAAFSGPQYDCCLLTLRLSNQTASFQRLQNQI